MSPHFRDGVEDSSGTTPKTLCGLGGCWSYACVQPKRRRYSLTWIHVRRRSCEHCKVELRVEAVTQTECRRPVRKFSGSALRKRCFLKVYGMAWALPLIWFIFVLCARPPANLNAALPDSHGPILADVVFFQSFASYAWIAWQHGGFRASRPIFLSPENENAEVATHSHPTCRWSMSELDSVLSWTLCKVYL